MLGLLIFTWGQARGQTPTNIGGWMPDKGAICIVSDATHIYLGGNFNMMVKEGLAGTFNSGVGLQITGTGQHIAGFPFVNGTVRVCIPDGAGGWYIGGYFTKVGSFVRNRIAHILPDMTVNPTWNPNADNGVLALTISGTDLYAGGDFSNIGGQTRNNIAKLSTTGTGLADATWNPNANNTIQALTLSFTDLYVGGNFTNIGGQTRNRIAKITTTGAGTADATWNPNADQDVETLALSGTDLYVGGFFNSIGGQARNRIAKIATTGAGIADAIWNPNATTIINGVHAMAFSGTDLYVGGYFTSIGGQFRSSIAKLSTTGTGLADATWNPNASGVSFPAVFALAISGTELYAGGSFTVIGGEVRNSIARIQKSNMELDLTWNPNANGTVATLALSSTDLYVGGNFTNIGGQARNRLAKLSTTGTGVADATWNPNADNIVNSLLLSGTDLYVGGGFNNVGGQTRNRLAKLSTTGTGTADGIWNPNPDAGNIQALIISGTELYVGGSFANIGGQARNSIAKISTTGTGSADITWNPNADDTVVELTLSGTDLYVGGGFTNIGGQVRNRIAKLTTTGVGNPDVTWNLNAESYSIN
jgi:hypothetical protein